MNEDCIITINTSKGTIKLNKNMEIKCFLHAACYLVEAIKKYNKESREEVLADIREFLAEADKLQEEKNKNKIIEVDFIKKEIIK